jgi:4-aminobutyrate aminotransferase-like enzyme
LPPGLAHFSIRQACGLEPIPRSGALAFWLKENTGSFASVLEGIDLRTEPCVVFDLSIGSLMLGANPAAIETPVLTKTLFEEMSRANCHVGIGRYDEARALYLTGTFATGSHPTDERRTVHIGLDLFIEAGAPICSPLDGVVHSFANRAAKCDYGPVIILKHEPPGAPPFYTLYGHLSIESLNGVHVGKKIVRGERFAWIGAPPINGDWTPHLHFQIMLDLLGFVGDFPGVCLASQRQVWLSNSPDPNLIVGIPEASIPLYDVPNGVVQFMREDAAGPSLSLSYREPLQIVRGWRQYLYDETGRAFLDTYNNVPIVGHSHPHVVEAVQRQIALLNTNTRYLHLTMAKYAGLLAGACDLDVCYFLNSASEANELAIRMARAHTGREDIIVLEHAYHGHTNTLIDISPYKFDGPGGRGRKPWVHVAPIPDDYRGSYKRDDPERGVKYAAHVAEICERTPPAAFIGESLPSVGGQIVLPHGYLREAYKHVRASGGVCIADEVQVGFGRLGKWQWGYQMQGVQPDIVVLGKPIANGFPLGAVITTRKIAESFDNGMEFFSTFGGNPVAMAAGLETFRVLTEERLQENARIVGDYWLDKLRGVMSKHEIIGDVRGAGLFLGVELVRNRGTLEPAAEEASYVVNRLRERGILTGTDGPHHNVIKLRPPLIFTKDDADFFVRVFDDVLGEDAVTANLS